MMFCGTCIQKDSCFPATSYIHELVFDEMFPSDRDQTVEMSHCSAGDGERTLITAGQRAELVMSGISQLGMFTLVCVPQMLFLCLRSPLHPYERVLCGQGCVQYSVFPMFLRCVFGSTFSCSNDYTVRKDTRAFLSDRCQGLCSGTMLSISFSIDLTKQGSSNHMKNNL